MLLPTQQTQDVEPMLGHRLRRRPNIKVKSPLGLTSNDVSECSRAVSAISGKQRDNAFHKNTVEYCENISVSAGLMRLKLGEVKQYLFENKAQHFK